MKHSIALVLLFGASVAVAAPPVPTADATPQVVREVPDVVSASGPEAVTVTGARPKKYDLTAPGLFAFKSTAPRSMSSPPSVDLVTEPVLLTVRTGNTEELRQKHFAFPFENDQERVVRDSDVLKIRLAKFKLD